MLPDTGPSIEEQIENVEKTGEEQSYDEVNGKLPEGEQENLDQAFAEWESFFSEDEGKSLTP